MSTNSRHVVDMHVRTPCEFPAYSFSGREGNELQVLETPPFVMPVLQQLERVCSVYLIIPGGRDRISNVCSFDPACFSPPSQFC